MILLPRPSRKQGGQPTEILPGGGSPVRWSSQPPSKSFALTPGEVVSNAGVEMRLYRKVLISEAPGIAAAVKSVQQSGLATHGAVRNRTGESARAVVPVFVISIILKYKEDPHMNNPNIDLLGQVNLLKALLEAGVINDIEFKKIAARLAVKNGASIIIC